jgi:REP element-mobilizing transposase RayT
MNADPHARQGPAADAPDPLVHGMHSRGALPHLKRAGASYFVTFRLAGTLPQEVLARLKQEREAIIQTARAANRPLTWKEQTDLFNWYAERVDKYLDANQGDCWLRREDIAVLVANALHFFLGERYALHAWVIMPSHVHVVVRPELPWTLSQILKSWKNFTALEANKLLRRTGQHFWQDESYDHWCRDDEDRARCCSYTVFNPANARLCAAPEDWPWSSAWRGVPRWKGPRGATSVGQAYGLPVPGASGPGEQPAAGQG